jgi:hypothetical protein
LNVFHTRFGQNSTSVSDVIEVDAGVDIECKFKVSLCKFFFVKESKQKEYV